MARSRLAAATASATDACTGITSSSDTSRTTRRECGSGTTTRTHEPQPRARRADRTSEPRQSASKKPAPDMSTIRPSPPESSTAHSTPAIAGALGEPVPAGHPTTAHPANRRTGNPGPSRPRVLTTLRSLSAPDTNRACRQGPGRHTLKIDTPPRQQPLSTRQGARRRCGGPSGPRRLPARHRMHGPGLTPSFRWPRRSRCPRRRTECLKLLGRHGPRLGDSGLPGAPWGVPGRPGLATS